MIWYYDGRHAREFQVFDIYGNFLCVGRHSYFLNRAEYKWRYSGNLFDKLRHLFTYTHRETVFSPYNGNDVLSHEVCRFYPNYKTIHAIGTRHFDYTGNIVYTPIGAVIKRILHFIDG